MSGEPRDPTKAHFLLRQVRREDSSIAHDLVVIFALIFFVVMLPVALWPSRGIFGPPNDPWLWWPAIAIALLMAACMLDDHFERPVWQRVLVVITHTAFYVGFVGVFSAWHSAIAEPPALRALSRTACSPIMLVYGLHSSKAMVAWARRAQEGRIRYDSQGSPYLR